LILKGHIGSIQSLILFLYKLKLGVKDWEM